MGINRILQDIDDFSVMAALDNGEDAVTFCRKHTPDIVLMDIELPGIGGLEAIVQILRFCPDTKVVVITSHQEQPIPVKVMEAGAWGYLTKNADPSVMIDAIRKVYVGQKYVSPEVAQSIALAKLSAGDGNPFEQLSQRELEITIELTRGMKVPDIASQLCVSAKTVNTYRYRLFKKLDVKSDVELTHLALRHKIISGDLTE
jgi:two-component system invasion response regulator UvrY